MAYAPCRSMNADLWAGATDGKYKKIIEDRGGLPEGITPLYREDLYPTWYGITEAPDKVGVCGKPGLRTPGTVTPWDHTPPQPFEG